MKIKDLKKIFFHLVIFLVLSSCSVKYPSISDLYQDWRASKAVKNEKYEEAMSIYYEQLNSELNHPATHSNIGVLQSMTQNEDEALKSLNYALSLAEKEQDNVLIFAINFNLGVLYGKRKSVEQALEHYQKALDLVPTSLETKTNIELLVKQNSNQEQNKKDEKSDQNSSGEGGSNSEKSEDQKDKDDSEKKKEEQNNQDNKNDPNKEGDKNKEPENEGSKQSSPKYKPRPFEGETLAENDVKKILEELRSQEQKIRANFEKKEQQKGKQGVYGKDW